MKNNILAIDASDKKLKFLWKNKRFSHASISGRGQDAAIFNTLARMQVNFADIDVLALVMGPGSYTGLRLAFSFASGLAFDNSRLKVYGSNIFNLIADTKNSAKELILATSLRQDYFCCVMQEGKPLSEALCLNDVDLLNLCKNMEISSVKGADAKRFLTSEAVLASSYKKQLFFKKSLPPITALMRSLLAGKVVDELKHPFQPYYLRKNF